MDGVMGSAVERLKGIRNAFLSKPCAPNDHTMAWDMDGDSMRTCVTVLMMKCAER